MTDITTQAYDTQLGQARAATIDAMKYANEALELIECFPAVGEPFNAKQHDAIVVALKQAGAAIREAQSYVTG